MPLTPHSTKKANPLKAWEKVGPHEGVSTRRRSAILQASSPTSQSPNPGASAERQNMKTQITNVQPNTTSDRETSGCRGSLVDGRKDNISGKQRPECWQQQNVPLKQQRHASTPKVTTPDCDSMLATSVAQVASPTSNNTPTSDELFEIHDVTQGLHRLSHGPCDQSSPSSCSALTDMEKGDTSGEVVLKWDGRKQATSPATGSSFNARNSNVRLDEEPSESCDSIVDEESGSEVTMSLGTEAIDQLQATNEDLRSESKYYQLMAAITMKTSSLRRGFMRSPIRPSDLPSNLCGLHHKLMTDGLRVPNAAADRAHIVADTIQLHLTWEADNLSNCINPTAAVNNFVDFVGLFIPQIYGLATAEFVGGEDTRQVRAELSNVVMELLCWIVEQCVVLAESVVPGHHLSRNPVWEQAAIKALWDLDQCLLAACQKCLQYLPEARMTVHSEDAPGLYVNRIIDWALTQLRWTKNMADRLQRKVDMTPNSEEYEVLLFSLTQHSLNDYLRRAQEQHKLLRQVSDNKRKKISSLDMYNINLDQDDSF